MTFKSVEPEVWQHENEGDSVTGVYLSKQLEVGKYKSTAYKLEGQGGQQWIVFGNSVMDDKMEFAKVADLVKIIFKGKKGEKEYNDYDVQIDDGKVEDTKETEAKPEHGKLV